MHDGGHSWMLAMKACLCRRLLMRSRLQRFRVSALAARQYHRRAQTSGNTTSLIPLVLYYELRITSTLSLFPGIIVIWSLYLIAYLVDIWGFALSWRQVSHTQL